MQIFNWFEKFKGVNEIRICSLIFQTKSGLKSAKEIFQTKSGLKLAKELLKVGQSETEMKRRKQKGIIMLILSL